MNPAQQLILSKLNPSEQQQLMDAITYLGEKARDPSGYLAEGSVASFINRQPPAVRNAIAHISEAMETPRGRPFLEKWSEHQNAQAFGFDPDAAVTIKSALDTSDVLQGTIDRLGGSDADHAAELDTPELSRQEQIAAAFDLHSQEN